MRNKPVRRTLRLHLLRRLPKRQRLRLRKDIREQNVVMGSQRIKRFVEPNEVARDQPRSLVDQLIERVLPIRARLAPINRPGVIANFFAPERDMLAIALHGELLKIRREALEVLLVGQYRDGLRIEEVRVPDGKQSQQHGQ